MSFVTFDDFSLRYGSTVPSTDEERVEAYLADACAMVEDLTGTVYTDDSGVPQALVAVVCTAVRRVYDNPQGLTGETVGNYSWQASRASGAGLYFTQEERRIILRAAGKSGMVSMTVYGDLPVADDDEQYLTTTDDGDSVLYFDQDDLV
jgi:hypothetical protein